MPSSSIKFHPSMSPWVFIQVKNEWAMSTRHSANRNQVVLDTIFSSCASSCCILEPGVTSWEQCQGQANHYLQLMTFWRLYTLKFLLSLFPLNSSLSSFGFDFKLFGTRIIIFSVWKRPESLQISLHSPEDKWWLHRHVKWCFLLPKERFVVLELSPTIRSFIHSYSTTQLLTAFLLFLNCCISVQIKLSAALEVPGAFSSLQAQPCQAEPKSTFHPLSKPPLPASVSTATSTVPSGRQT